MSVTLPDQWRPRRRSIHIAYVKIPASRLRDADLDVSDLVASIERQGLQQPIGVRGNDRDWQLIWGRRRLEAHRREPERLGRDISALVYPPDLPDSWARLLEIDENDQRQDLTPDERAASTVERAATIKVIEEIESHESLTKSGFTPGDTFTPKPRTGRGHKGIVQKVAEQQRVDQAAVRKRVKKVSEAIGEPVDLEKDTSEQLTGKAAKFRDQAKAHDAERKASRKKVREAAKPVAKPARPDLAEMIRDLNVAWPGRDVHAWHPDDRQLAELKLHLPDLLLKLKALEGWLRPPPPDAVARAEPAVAAGGDKGAESRGNPSVPGL